MFFTSWQDFFNMGGYGLYVWLSYGISFIAVLWLVISSIREKNLILQELKHEALREQRLQQTTQENVL